MCQVEREPLPFQPGRNVLRAAPCALEEEWRAGPLLCLGQPDVGDEFDGEREQESEKKQNPGAQRMQDD